MAILRSMDGKFYNIPDEQLEEHLVPADEVKERLGSELGSEDQGPGGQPYSMPAGGGVTIQVFPGGQGGGQSGPPAEQQQQGEGDSVQPHGYGWRNWRNCWRNAWRNCWP